MSTFFWTIFIKGCMFFQGIAKVIVEKGNQLKTSS